MSSQALEKQAETEGQAERSQGGTRNQGSSTLDSARSKHAVIPALRSRARRIRGSTPELHKNLSQKVEIKIKTEHSEGNYVPSQEILEKTFINSLTGV